MKHSQQLKWEVFSHLFLLASYFFLLSARAADVPCPLNLQQAEQIALAQHPRISVAHLTALASRQSAKAVQSAFLPNIYASATAVGTADPNNTRIAAGALNNPLVYDREIGRAHV